MDKSKITKNLLDWLIYIAIAIVLALLINNFVLINANIPSSSMEKTIMTNDRLFGYRLAYLFSEPKRGDIIIFDPPDKGEDPLVKRIIGLPFDKVEIISGKVYINDRVLTESYILVSSNGDWGPYKVPENSYFMMGDNRNISKDSRFWDNTFLDKKDIIGKAIFKYWPKPKLIH